MGKAFMLSIILMVLLVFCPVAMALSPIDKVWECSEWNASDVGPAHCVPCEEGLQVHISGPPYTLYSAVQFPGKARYYHEWNVELESSLDCGAFGIAIGNAATGLIFQVSDRKVAEVLFYRDQQSIQPKLSKTFRTQGNDYVLKVRYDAQKKHCSFSVNDDEIFNFCAKEMPGLPMTSSVRRVAVTTSTVKGKRTASVLHKRVWVLAR